VLARRTSLPRAEAPRYQQESPDKPSSTTIALRRGRK